ncbi:MAG: hypothetical protein IJF75_02300 [Clostridia bacterium]|nr:hypothetical protein [Clostridia bacterium]
MDYINVLSGIFFAILIVGTLYVLTMGIYFSCRNKSIGKKWGVEILVAAFAYLVSVAVKFITFLIEKTGDITVLDSVELFWRAIYSGIGGFAFEGLDGFESVSVLSRCLYVGSSLYAGLIALTVVSTKVSHVIYSKIVLSSRKITMSIKTFFKLFFKKINNNIDVYVFTAVTDDALLLAKSIDEKYKTDIKKKSREIIFSGAEIEAFDRKNPLHAEIISQGYLYLPFAKSDKSSSMLKFFNFLFKNDGCLIDEKLAIIKPKLDGKKLEKACASYKIKNRSMSKVHVFALELNEGKTGLEAVNGGVIFDEIESIIQNTVKKGKIKLSTIVDFYALTDGDINYQYYEARLDKVVSDSLNLIGIKDEKTSSFVRKYFQLHTMNEADISAECLLEERNALFSKDGGSLLLKDNAQNDYKVLVLGLGDNGRAALNSLFINTACIDEDGNPTRFSADVFDLRSSNVSGTYTFSHPLYKVADLGKKLETDDSDFIGTDKKLKEMYSDTVIQKRIAKLNAIQEKITNGDKDYIKHPKVWIESFEKEQIKDFADVNKAMGFPEISLHSTSCFDLSFMRYLDSKTGVESESLSQKFVYNAIIVTLGDDEANISMANSIIDDIKHELDIADKKEQNKLQIIYVNLREKGNYSRINWTAQDKEYYNNFQVVVYGDAEKMYSFDHVLDESENKKYNLFYTLAFSGDNKINEAQRKLDVVVNNYEKEKDNDFYNLLKSAKQVMNELYTDELSDKCWINQSLFVKKSNRYAHLFANYHDSYIKERIKSTGKLSGKELLKLAKIEHVRWNRFHMANGWVFKDYEKKDKKECRRKHEHDALCPFEMLVYKNSDIVNIAVVCDED